MQPSHSGARTRPEPLSTRDASEPASVTGRLVVVSNRVGPVDDTTRAGGLAVALLDTLRATGGLWFGWSGKVDERPLGVPTLERHRGITVATLDLTPAEHAHYYNGYANGSLWPLFHSSLERARFRRVDRDAYCGVNRRFACALEPLLEDDDLVWVHDYHLLPLGEELRALGCEQPLGFFLHIPFPAPEVLRALPEHDRLLRGLFAYDVVGFQSERDRRCFVAYVLDELGGNVEGADTVHAFGRAITCRVFPIGIDTGAFHRAATSPEAAAQAEIMAKALHDRLAIVGVDRLDYTKGLPQRFEAFARFLADYPAQRGRASFVQIAPTSRGEVEQYARLREELERLSGAINGAYAELDWTPLRYINRGYSRVALAGIYRLARVGLVTPLRDGMNLVAKEFVAAQSEDDPGVLVLSRFAGAAEHADGALLVNPYDIKGVADAIQTALDMPHEERRERWRRLHAAFGAYDVGRWRNDFVATLAAYALPSRAARPAYGQSAA